MEVIRSVAGSFLLLSTDQITRIPSAPVPAFPWLAEFFIEWKWDLSFRQTWGFKWEKNSFWWKGSAEQFKQKNKKKIKLWNSRLMYCSHLTCRSQSEYFLKHLKKKTSIGFHSCSSSEREHSQTRVMPAGQSLRPSCRHKRPRLCPTPSLYRQCRCFPTTVSVCNCTIVNTLLAHLHCNC